MEKKIKRRSKRKEEEEERARWVLDGISEVPLNIHRKEIS